MFLFPFTPHVLVPFGRSETVTKKKRLFPTKHVKIYATRPKTASNNCGLQCLRLLFQRWGIPKRSSKLHLKLTPQLERGIPSWNHNFIELPPKNKPFHNSFCPLFQSTPHLSYTLKNLTHTQWKFQSCIFDLSTSKFFFLNSESEDSQLCTGAGCLAPCAGTGFGRTTEVQTSSMHGVVCPLEKYGMPRLWLKQEVFLGGWIFLLWSFFSWEVSLRWSNWDDPIEKKQPRNDD